MINHFFSWILWLGYVPIFLFLWVVPAQSLSGKAIATFCLVAFWDFVVHTINHKKAVEIPTEVGAWIVTLVLLSPFVPFVSMWQITWIIACQVIWDLSWHAASAHRIKESDHREAFDHGWIRVVVATIALGIFFFWPESEVASAFHEEVPRVWRWWWYGPIVA